jgi:peptide/nickel transport system substrate-binding protein
MAKTLTRRAALATAAAAAAGFPARAAAQDAKLSVASQLLPSSLEPMGIPAQTSVVYRTEYSIFDGLLGLDYRRNAAVRPMLAEAYRRFDDHTWEFTLRRGVIFHDGREMTADDVVFSFGPERLTGKDAPAHAAMIAFLPTLDGVEKVDERTVRLTTKSPDPAFDKRIASWGGQVISCDAYLRAASFQAWSEAPVLTAWRDSSTTTPSSSRATTPIGAASRPMPAFGSGRCPSCRAGSPGFSPGTSISRPIWRPM